MSSRIHVLLPAVSLLAASLSAGNLSTVGAEDPVTFSGVDIVVGGMLKEEGGRWDPGTSPLTRPFGIDFNRSGDMFIVELEGGRVHQLSSSGELSKISGDGSKSYLGDGGPAAGATFNGMHNCAVSPNATSTLRTAGITAFAGLKQRPV